MGLDESRGMQGVKSNNHTDHWEKKLIVKSRQDWYIHYVHNSPAFKNIQQKTKQMNRSRKGVIWWQNLSCTKSKAVIVHGTAEREHVNHHIVVASCTQPFRTIILGHLWGHKNLQYANILWIYWKYCLLKQRPSFLPRWHPANIQNRGTDSVGTLKRKKNSKLRFKWHDTFFFKYI